MAEAQTNPKPGYNKPEIIETIEWIALITTIIIAIYKLKQK